MSYFKEEETYRRILVKISNINFMKTRPLGFALFYEEKRPI